MADDKKEAQKPAPGYNSVDRKGTWFLSNAVYPLEDPTPIHEHGKGQTMTRFEPGSYTQATETGWTETQWRSGVLTKYDGDPRDDDTKAIVYVKPKAEEPAAAPAPSPTPAPVKK